MQTEGREQYKKICRRVEKLELSFTAGCNKRVDIWSPEKSRCHHQHNMLGWHKIVHTCGRRVDFWRPQRWASKAPTSNHVKTQLKSNGPFQMLRISFNCIAEKGVSNVSLQTIQKLAWSQSGLESKGLNDFLLSFDSINWTHFVNYPENSFVIIKP